MPLAWTEFTQSGDGTIALLESQDTSVIIVTGDPILDNADDELVVTRFALGIFGQVSKLGNILTKIDRLRLFLGCWKFTATYTNPSFNRNTGDTTFCFTTGGGTQHITHSRRTVSSYPQNAPNMRQAINVSGAGQADGVDIDVASFDFKITFYPPASVMTTAFTDLLFDLSDFVNSDKVVMNVDGIQRTFAPGELRFLNAEGSKRLGGDWELTLNFSSKKNANNLSVGSFTGIIKRGWDYLWVYTAGGVDANSLVPVPTAVYVEEVYGYAPITPLLTPSGYASVNLQNWTHLIA